VSTGRDLSHGSVQPCVQVTFKSASKRGNRSWTMNAFTRIRTRFPAALDLLRSTVDGAVLVPEDAGYKRRAMAAGSPPSTSVRP